jgi:hypothetical protein
MALFIDHGRPGRPRRPAGGAGPDAADGGADRAGGGPAGRSA